VEEEEEKEKEEEEKKKKSYRYGEQPTKLSVITLLPNGFVSNRVHVSVDEQGYIHIYLFNCNWAFARWQCLQKNIHSTRKPHIHFTTSHSTAQQ
jgi:hypothetical protein